MNVTPAAYAHFINALSALSNGKLCVLLEGGYCIKSLSEGVALTVRALLGYPTPRIETLTRPDPVFVDSLMNLISLLRPHWKCLTNLNDSETNGLKLSDYLKKWDEDYRKDKGIPYYDYNNRPEKFPLTGFYPLYSEEENVQLDAEIEHLIQVTDLGFPKHRTGLIIENQMVKKCTAIQSEVGKSVLKIVDEIAHKNVKTYLQIILFFDTQLFNILNLSSFKDYE
jgi:histone deacetylase 6